MKIKASNIKIPIEVLDELTNQVIEIITCIKHEDLEWLKSYSDDPDIEEKQDNFYHFVHVNLQKVLQDHNLDPVDLRKEKNNE